MILDSGIKHHVESSLNIGGATPVRVGHTHNLITEVHTFSLDESRIGAESDEVVSEGTLSLLGAVQTQGDGNIDRSISGRAAHGTGGIHDSHTVEGSTIEIVSQVVPILVHHQTIGVVHGSIARVAIHTVTHSLEGFSDTLVRIQRLGVDLLSSVLSEVGVGLDILVGTHAVNVMLSESILILHAGLGRNLIELDFIPLTSRHQTLQHVDTLTQDRKSLSILLMSHAQVLTSDVSQTNRFLGGSVLGL